MIPIMPCDFVFTRFVGIYKFKVEDKERRCF